MVMPPAAPVPRILLCHLAHLGAAARCSISNHVEKGKLASPCPLHTYVMLPSAALPSRCCQRPLQRQFSETPSFVACCAAATYVTVQHSATYVTVLRVQAVRNLTVDMTD